MIASFSFLENDYAFERRPAERCDFEYARDASVAVPYYGPAVAVEVAFSPGESKVAAAIYELQDGRKPEQASSYGDAGAGRAITVDTFVSMASGGTVDPVLPQITPNMSFAAMGRTGEARTAMLRANMEGVVAQIAERVKTWCAPILKGDTSMFPAVQAYHRQLYDPRSW